MPRKLARVRRGDPISAEQHNLLVDAINALQEITVSGPLELRRHAGGVQLGLAHETRLWLFEITSAAPTETSDQVRYWDAARVRLDGNNEYAAATPTSVRLYDPARDYLGGQLGNVPLHAGQWVWATFNADTGRWEILRDPFPTRRRVLLQANIASAGNISSKVSCKLAGWNGLTIAAAGSAFDVYVYHAWMRHAAAGSVGYAQYHADRDAWELESVTGISHWLEGTLNSGLLTTDATVLGTVTRHYQFGEGYYKSDHTFTSSAGGEVSLKNTGKFSADAGDWFRAMLQDVEGQEWASYIIDNTGCADGSS